MAAIVSANAAAGQTPNDAGMLWFTAQSLSKSVCISGRETASADMGIVVYVANLPVSQIVRADSVLGHRAEGLRHLSFDGRYGVRISKHEFAPPVGYDTEVELFNTGSNWQQTIELKTGHDIGARLTRDGGKILLSCLHGHNASDISEWRPTLLVYEQTAEAYTLRSECCDWAPGSRWGEPNFQRTRWGPKAGPARINGQYGNTSARRFTTPAQKN